MSREQEAERLTHMEMLQEMVSSTIVDSFCGTFEPVANQLSASRILYDIDIREFFSIMFQSYQKTGLDPINAVKEVLSDRGFIQQVSYDGRPCYFVRYKNAEEGDY